MQSTTYSDLLKDPRWQKKRLEILNRDNWTCQRCHDAEHTLHVHHKIYRQGAPWDYSDECLVTLCENCHSDETQERPECEKLLLRSLRLFGFFYDDLHSIMCGLGLGTCGPPPELLSSALEWLFQNPGAQADLVDAYFRALPHRKKDAGEPK